MGSYVHLPERNRRRTEDSRSKAARPADSRWNRTGRGTEIVAGIQNSPSTGYFFGEKAGFSACQTLRDFMWADAGGRVSVFGFLTRTRGGRRMPVSNRPSYQFGIDRYTEITCCCAVFANDTNSPAPPVPSEIRCSAADDFRIPARALPAASLRETRVRRLVLIRCGAGHEKRYSDVAAGI